VGHGRGAGRWRYPFVRCVRRPGTRQATFRRKRFHLTGSPADLVATKWIKKQAAGLALNDADFDPRSG
jgi:hypothetical protein